MDATKQNNKTPNFSTARPLAARFEEIEIGLIDDPVRAMRSDMSTENIDDLVMSIKQVGIIEPLVVRENGDRFEIVAGHRRITAAEAAGLHKVPCHVVSGTQEQIETMKIHENLYRVDINPFDEAQHYARLIKDLKLSPTKICRITNRSEQYVRDRLSILEYDPVLQAALAKGEIKITVAKELSRIADPLKLREMTGYAKAHGITASVAKRWVDEQMPRENPAPGLPDIPTEQFQGESASEQHSDCFFCLKPVRLFEAYTVYVHEGCVGERQKVAQEEEAALEAQQ